MMDEEYDITFTTDWIESDCDWNYLQSMVESIQLNQEQLNEENNTD